MAGSSQSHGAPASPAANFTKPAISGNNLTAGLEWSARDLWGMSLHNPSQ
jgi:hypothetical protein